MDLCAAREKLDQIEEAMRPLEKLDPDEDEICEGREGRADIRKDATVSLLGKLSQAGADRQNYDLSCLLNVA